MQFDEVVSWLGNAIFLAGQLAQVRTTWESKRSEDLSYLSLLLALTGNFLFFLYGICSGSTSMTWGMGSATVASSFQLYLKHRYDTDSVRNMYIQLDAAMPVTLPDIVLPEFIVRSRSCSIASTSNKEKGSSLALDLMEQQGQVLNGSNSPSTPRNYNARLLSGNAHTLNSILELQDRLVETQQHQQQNQFDEKQLSESYQHPAFFPSRDRASS